MLTLLKDLRYGLRGLADAPGFALAAILTIALGAGANTAIFTIVNSVLLRPLDYPEPERLVRVWPEKVFNEDMLTEVREQASSYLGLTGYAIARFTLAQGSTSRALRGALVAVEHFDVIGVHPRIGRGFEHGEQWAGAEDAVILSHALWQREFGGEAAIVGQTVDVAGAGYARHRIVGVMPPTYRPLVSGIEVWAPLAMDPDSDAFQGSYGIRAIARLAPEVSVESASAEMAALVAEFAERHPTQFREARFSPVDVVGLRETLVRDIRPTLLMIFGSVALILLIGCSNVANLLLARSAGRRREVAIRMALGAGRRRVLRQMLTESLLLGLLGAALGLFGGSLLLRSLADTVGRYLPRADEIVLDLRVFAFTASVAVVAAILFGVIPAVRIAGVAPHAVLSAGGRSGSGDRGQRRLNDSLVVLEVALALTLVIAASLLFKSFANLRRVNSGFDPEHLAAVELVLPAGAYDEPAARAAYFGDALARLRALPGVSAAGAINAIPMTPGNAGISYLVEGQELPSGTPSLVGNLRVVTSGYLETLGVELIRGRLVSELDGEDTDPVVVINETMARRHWPDGEALGDRFTTVAGDPRFTVVGVVSDVQQHQLDRAPAPEFYVPAPQLAWFVDEILVRTEDPGALLGGLRATIRAVDPTVIVEDVRTMSMVVDETLGDPRFFTGLFSGFAAIALTLGIIGVYGVVVFGVSQQRRDIGVRVALGATPKRVVAEVVGRSSKPILIGVALGGALATLTSRLLSSRLYEVSVTDPLVFAATAVFLVVVAVGATYIPARRAAATDPLEAMRPD